MIGAGRAGQVSSETEALPQELEQAGKMVDQLIRHLMDKDLPPLAIASALLGGSMGLLSRTLGKRALLGVLGQATDAVRSGQFEDLSDEEPASRA